MFDQTFVNAQTHARRPWTMAVSLSIQTGLVALAVIIPLMHPDILRPNLQIPVYLPLRPIHQQPAPVTVTAATRATPVTRPFLQIAPLTSPAHIPSHVAMIAEDAPATGFLGSASGLEFAGLGAVASVLLPERSFPPPPEVKRAVKPEPPKGPVKVSSGVQSAMLLFGPHPAYPTIAKAARVEGLVRIAATITTEGTIRNLQIVSGPPLLINAALDAVKQWRYKPTLLNGNAVEVLTEIDVNFALSGRP